MSIFWRRFLASLTPGVQGVVVALVLVWLVNLGGILSHTFELHNWLVLSGPSFCHGQVWRLVTYPLLPGGITDLVMNCVAVIILGGLLERHWSRGQFWIYCLVAVTGAGLAKVIWQWVSPQPLFGAAPLVFGLLIAWCYLCGRESVNLPMFGGVTVWKLVFIVGAVSIVGTFLSAGLVAALILAAGGLTGFLYLWMKHQWLMHRAGSVVHSERIQRLEL